MSTMHQYDYIFAIGVIFAALDAYNIGANDVANSFATSVASRSLTLRQACCAAAVCEFLGAVLVGARSSGTIKNGIMSLSIFRGNAGVQMLGFTCALTASASWLMVCTHQSWPVSTTYSIVSALAGSAVALAGGNAVQWGWNNARGVSAIYAGMVIAPAISAGFGSIVYLISKYGALDRKNPVRSAMILAPFYFFTVAAVLTMSIVYKGAPSLNLADLPQTTVALAIVLTALVVAILSIVFWMPYVHAKVIKHDYTIRWYHFFYGPLLWRRPAPEVTLEQAASAVPDYRVYGREDDDDAYRRADAGADIENRLASGGSERAPESPTAEGANSSAASANEEKNAHADAPASIPLTHKQHKYTQANKPKHDRAPLSAVEAESREHRIEGAWILPKNLWIIIRYKIPRILLHGSSVDIHKLQLGGPKSEQRIAEMHQIAKQYDNEVEHLYSFLQVLTACTNSFAHGANDVANAIGPFAAIYHNWSTGTITNSRTDTPVWVILADYVSMLAFGGVMIVIGLATYGYNIMSAIGNRLTMHSPSRGFSMEFGAAITVLLASQYAIPVSTTMCICGATAGVGLVSSGWRSLNYRGFGWIILGWILTVPIAGTLAGVLTGLFINAPHW